MKKVAYYLFLLIFLNISLKGKAQPGKEHNLLFDSLAGRWDEAIPLGNGWLGALIWQKNNKIRLSLDRVDLWDERPMPEIDKLTYKWVREKVKLNQYDSVQKRGDEPYEKYPAPTKIPGAALEFDMERLGKVISNELDINTGLSVIKFENGVLFNNYVHASKLVGYFGWENVPEDIINPELIIPNYNSGKKGIEGNSVEGQGLEQLGYKKGTIIKAAGSILYHQPTWQNNYYEVLVKWNRMPGNKIIGQWTISNNKPAMLPDIQSSLKEPTYWPSHIQWWEDYWSRSSVTLPDNQLEKQYYLEMYKFACVARSNTAPISLQAIWTADNGNLPPWKGDFHHDLNTQLSYWPGYSGNHLDLTAGYTNWLWKVKEVNKRWTKRYFDISGLNVPGVTTISGKEMGGWVQYSMSPTTAAWLAQHFYWQWKYSMDKVYLEKYAFPYINEAAVFLDNLSSPKGDIRKIDLSSSPEYNDNRVTAWFKDWTNYDLSLAFSLFRMNAAVHDFIGQKKTSTYWYSIKKELPGYNINESGLTIAPGQNLDQSHRHHAQLMAIHPLGLLNVEDSTGNDIIKKSLRHLEKIGTREWCGYSFSWAASIYARAKEADNAVKMLQIFASNFCSSNSFHLNGDQKGGQYSNFTYRPFTLEGNFAFAQGVHELLIQSHKGYIEVFPAVPESWKDVSFNTLRTVGAFLVSARKVNGIIDQIIVTAEAGGKLYLKLPFQTFHFTNNKKKYKVLTGILETDMKKGETIIIKNGQQ
jgi:alpha-L-fucosidase 2